MILFYRGLHIGPVQFENTKIGCNVECIFPRVVVSMLPNAEIGPNNHQEVAFHFKNTEVSEGNSKKKHGNGDELNFKGTIIIFVFISLIISVVDVNIDSFVIDDHGFS